LRKEIFGLLKSGDGQDQRKRAVSPCLLPIKDAAMQLPYDIGDFSDFYASIYHATNAGSMLRPQNPLLPNYKFVPVAYHGRSSSFIVSGSPVTRPCGQRRLDHDAPEFGASQQLDYEAEVAFVVGTGNALGHPISIGEAASHLFGLGLLNDWSARDIQAWEYQPLGPFLAKSFACTLSPWVVTMEALAPFRVKAATRPAGDPAPLKYLTSPDQNEAAAFDLGVEVLISSKAMRERGLAPHRISLSNLRHMYWTAAQLLTHQSSNGCNLRPGDILGSGTVSGPDKGSYSCLLEVTWRGANPLELPSGETRKFLEDGDEVIIRGRCEKDGFASIGLGECRSIILPSHASA
jgi:fumarylacetoacetase